MIPPFNKPAFGKPFGDPFGKGFGGHEDFKPTDIDNLVLWLDAGVGITPNGANASGWADRSTKGNDLSQSVAAKQPIIRPKCSIGR